MSKERIPESSDEIVQYKKLYNKLYYESHKEHCRIRNKEYYIKNQERYKNIRKKYYEEHRKELISKTDRWRRANKEKRKKTQRKAQIRRYGIDVVDYDNLFKKQNGCCVICGKKSLDINKPLCIDHNHSTKKVRGLLCISCNTKLGWFEKYRTPVINYLDTN